MELGKCSILLGIANRLDSNNLNSKVYKGLFFIVLSHIHFQVRITALSFYFEIIEFHLKLSTIPINDSLILLETRDFFEQI